MALDPRVTTGVRRRRLLVIDDDRLLATAVERCFNAEYEVVTTGSALTALGQIRGGAEFDVILSDLMMPDMTGMEFYAALHAVNPRYAERIIFLTGGAFTGRVIDFLASVPNVRLEKPFDVPHLQAVVRNSLR